MTETVDPDPYATGGIRGQAALGGRQEPSDGDPTAGGRRGQLGTTRSIAADEPDDGGAAIPVGGGSVTEEPDAPPGAEPGGVDDAAGTGPDEVP